MIRLGRVARRILRRLGAPVLVVPPDLRAEQIGGGPVTALTSVSADSARACRFAADLAARLGRPLAARASHAPYLAREPTERARKARAAERLAALAAWSRPLSEQRRA